MMKKAYILDTDIGVDSDDAIALAVLLSAHKRKDIDLSLISLCTKRSGAVATTKAILDEYDLDIPICQTTTHLSCDNINNYAFKIMNEYHFDDSCLDSIKAWKNLYESSLEEIVPIVIGPLTNLAEFISNYPLLFIKKTKKVYLMMGNFTNKECEWNVEQNIKSAIEVIKNIKCSCYVLSSEVGNKVLTGKTFINNRDNVVGKCIQYFYNANHIFEEDKMLRPSWDPLTVLAVIHHELFTMTQGTIDIAENGITNFKKDEHGNFYLLDVKSSNSCELAIEKYLNEHLKK